MAVAPIVLLDAEQQRTLQQAAHGRSSSGAGQPPPPLRRSSLGRTSVPSLPTPPPLYEPRTNFTSAARTDFRSEPRTDFTSATRQLEPAAPGTISTRGTDFTNNTFTSSSPKTNFTTSQRVTADFDPTYGDYTPMMMSGRLSDTRESEDRDDRRAGYAGSSSNLRISVPLILLGVVLGVGLGVFISTVKVSALTAEWIALPGDLFVRALKALVIPYVFCSVAVAIGDIVFVGKVSIVGLQTFKVFAIMWVTTTVLSMSVALLFRPFFRLDRAYIPAPINAVGFTCADGTVLSLEPTDATLACSANGTVSSGSGAAAFAVRDMNNVFEKNVRRALALLTVSDQVIAMLDLIVPSNIFQALVNSDLLSVITFAMVLGAIAGRSYFTKTRRVNYLYLVLLQLRNAFFLAMEWVTWLTPVAVVSIIAGSFAANQDAFKQLGDVYMYVVAVLSTAVLQLFVTQPATIFLLTRCNPYRHMLHMTRAYVFAFGVSSSLATAPVTLACVKKARVCSQSLANFVVSIGASSNMTGMAIYLPTAIIFLAESSGVGHELTIWRLFAIFLLTLLSCAGTPPIPNAGIAIVASTYRTVFGVNQPPVTFFLFIAVDFLVDRIVTTCSVNDDIMALKVIAENTDETIVGDHLGERE